MLTAEQISEYREKGYVVPDYRLSDELLEGRDRQAAILSPCVSKSGSLRGPQAGFEGQQSH
jgi:hypothetical protein